MAVIDLAPPTINGMWISGHQYKMVDTRTHTTRMITVPGAGYSALVEQSELLDIVEEYKERFQQDMKDKPKFQVMDRKKQHDFGATLLQIRQSKKRRHETGSPRYH